MKRVLGLSPRSSRSLFITRCGRCVLNMPGICVQRTIGLRRWIADRRPCRSRRTSPCSSMGRRALARKAAMANGPHLTRAECPASPPHLARLLGGQACKRVEAEQLGRWVEVPEEVERVAEEDAEPSTCTCTCCGCACTCACACHVHVHHYACMLWCGCGVTCGVNAVCMRCTVRGVCSMQYACNLPNAAHVYRDIPLPSAPPAQAGHMPSARMPLTTAGTSVRQILRMLHE